MQMQNLKQMFQREKLLTVSNIAVMTITFLILGLFISIVAYSQTAIRNLEKQAQISVFFKDDFVEANILNLKADLEQDKRIDKITYISKEDAYKIFTEINKDDPIILESVTAKILPASLEIRATNIKNLSPLAQELSQNDGVEEVKFFEDVIKKFKFWRNIAYGVGASFAFISLLISFSVIIVSLRITINSKGEELEILKLVGASDMFVKQPLIDMGIFFGTASALIASLILIIISLIFNIAGAGGRYIELGFLPNVLINITVFAFLLSAILIVVGTSLGYFGSKAAIKKYLKY